MTSSLINEDSTQGKDPFSLYLGINNPSNLTSKKPNCGKHGFMFLPPWKGTLDLFRIHLIMLKNQEFSLNKLFCQLNTPCCHLKNIQTVVIIHSLISKIIIRFYQWMQVIITFS
jgi:hypothetical protein